MELANSDQVLSYLHKKGIVDSQDCTFEVLSGGVSSDVNLIRTKLGCMVIKRALPKLRVQEEWNVSIERSLTEKRCLELLNTLVPGAVPRVLFSDDSHYLFAMEYIEDASVWKQDLLSGNTESEISCQLGKILATIHRLTYQNDELLTPFEDKKLFFDLRISPYFLFIREKFPLYTKFIDHVVEQLMAENDVLVHGDFSPKNILIKNNKVLILDCEVAHAGHPSFDLSFLMHHLLLKSVHISQKKREYLSLARDFYQTYFQHIGVLKEEFYREITLQTTGALILARIDGKSPVEYLTEPERQTARKLGILLLDQSIVDLDEFIQMEDFKSGSH